MKKSETLLEGFINRRVQDYQEPERKGTPKGDPVGFSRAKFHGALLYRLTNRKQKDLASYLNVSYGLFRQWVLDEEFKYGSVGHRAREAFIEDLKWYFCEKSGVKEVKPRKIKRLNIEAEPQAMSTDALRSIKEGSEYYHPLSDSRSYDGVICDSLLDWAEGLDDLDFKQSLHMKFGLHGIFSSRERIRLKVKEALILFGNDELSDKEKTVISNALALAENELTK